MQQEIVRQRNEMQQVIVLQREMQQEIVGQRNEMQQVIVLQREMQQEIVRLSNRLNEQCDKYEELHNPHRQFR